MGHPDNVDPPASDAGATPSDRAAGPGASAAFEVVAVQAPQLTLERGRYLEAVFSASLLRFFGDAAAVRRAWDAESEAPDAWAQGQALAYGDVAAKLTDKEAAMLALRAEGGARFEVRWLPAE